MKKIFSLVFVISIFFTSCEKVDFGDTNVNPHGSTVADIDAMLRGGLQRYPGLGGRLYVANTTLYAQYQTQITQLQSQYDEKSAQLDSYKVGIQGQLAVFSSQLKGGTMLDGVRGLNFIESTVESHKKGNVWVELN